MRLHTVRMGQAPGRSPVVLLHGLFGAATNWGRVQRALAATHDVLAMDARNHGASGHDPDTSYGSMAEDVAETLAAEGVGAASVIGHSMGGKTAMRLALAHPALVSRLLVADVAPVIYPSHFGAMVAAMRAIPLHSGLTRADAQAALADAAPDPVIQGFLLQNLRFGETPAWRIGLDEIAAGLGGIESWGSSGTYEGSVLVLRGERSDYVLPEHRPLFRALFPRARFATLRDAGHWLHADAPEAFIATVGGFVA